MHISKLIGSLAIFAIVVAPLLPVVLLWFAFGELNAADGEATHGIQLGGPIAAYAAIFLILIGTLRRPIKDALTYTPPNPNMTTMIGLEGEWTVTAKSVNGTQASGECQFRLDANNSPAGSGHYRRKNGNLLGTWRTLEIVRNGTHLTYIYTLTDPNDQTEWVGYVNASINADQKAISGTWRVFGNTPKQGEIILCKAS